MLMISTFVRVVEAVVDRVVDKVAGDTALVGTAKRHRDVITVDYTDTT